MTGRKVALCLALATASAGVCGYGTSRQVECFNRVEAEYGVDSFQALPSEVVDDSGCLSLLNTAGALGTVASLGVGVVLVVRQRHAEVSSV